MRKLLFTFLFGALAANIFAQDASAPTAPYRSFSPADQWEVGVHVGMPFVNGDVAAKLPGFGGGIHVRKSLDNVFSVRLNSLVGKGSNEETNFNRSSDITWLSGGGELVVALNNLIWNKPYHKLLLNAYGGVGASRYTVDFKNIPTISDGKETYNSTYFNGGAGISYRVSPKFNIGLEYTVYSVFGKPGDLLDGDQNVGLGRTTFRDNFHYPHLTLCFNLGGKDKKTGLAKIEPRYWVNPLDGVATAISALEARAIYDPTDTDGDGIINDLDKEANSPADARVDTKGVTLDSDGDKVPDYKDKEPFSPIGYTIDPMGVAQVPKPKILTEDDVNRIVDAKLANFKLPTQASVVDWFLPMVNFDLNSYTIKKGEYEKLYQVAQVLKNNPTIRMVCTGNTDRLNSETYNNVLSYNRSNAVIAHMTTQYGVARDRLVLNWAGEGANIVPTNSANTSNRRVEFKVAKSETEMGRPEGKNAGTGRIEGNKSGF